MTADDSALTNETSPAGVPDGSAAADDPAVPNAEAGTERKVSTPWLARAGWAGIAAITTILALLVAVTELWQTSRQQPVSPIQPSGVGQTSGVVQVTADATPAAVEPAKQPVKATVASANAGGPKCGGKVFLLAGGVQDLAGPAGPPPPADLAPSEEVHGWFKAHGGTEVVKVVSFVVEGPPDQVAVLTGLTTVVDRQSATAGAVVGAWQCGAPASEREFVADLATSRVVGRASFGPAGTTPAPPAQFPYTVSTTDAEVFVVSLKQPPGEVIWHLELAWILNGVSGSTRIPPSGGFHSTDALYYSAETAAEYLKPLRGFPQLWAK